MKYALVKLSRYRFSATVDRATRFRIKFHIKGPASPSPPWFSLDGLHALRLV